MLLTGFGLDVEGLWCFGGPGIYILGLVRFCEDP